MKKNEIIKKLVIPVSYINKILPKKDYILIYSNQGFRDNSKALFDHLVNNGYVNKYKIICALEVKEKYKNIQTDKIKIVGKMEGIMWFLRSKYVFYCFGKYPIMPSKKQKVIHMWHGMPMKKIGNLEDRNKGDKYDYFSFVLATSEFFRPIMARAFNCRENRVIICGQPKTDDLGTTKEIKHILGIRTGKMVMWMPTYRVSERLDDKIVKTNINGLPIIDSHQKLEELDQVLVKNDVILYIKLHPAQTVTDIVSGKYKNIKFINDAKINKMGMTLYEFISGADGMISDYSSSYMDFLILNRPICFTIDDLDEYANTRGFVTENPVSIMPGELATTKKHIFRFIENLHNGTDYYYEKRLEIGNLLNEYPDFHNADRLLKICGIRC